MNAHVIWNRKILYYIYSDLSLIKWLLQITYSLMSLPRPILPIGNHYNEFGLYPVNILYFLSAYVFVQRLFPYIYIFLSGSECCKYLTIKMGNWLSGGHRTEEAGKLGTLVSEQVSPIFPWDIDSRFIVAVELGRNSESRCVNYFLLLLIKSYKKDG